MTTEKENPATQVKLVDFFALEPEELADNTEALEAVVEYQRSKRKVFYEEQKGKGRVKKEKPVAEVMEKKL